MATNDLYDKLQIEISLRPTFPGIDMKEMKTSQSVSVTRDTTRRRIEAPSADAACAEANEITDLAPLDDGELVLIVVKLAKVDANKNIQPIWVGNKDFTGPDSKVAVKLDGDGSVAFWKGATEPFGIPDKESLWIFNPNPKTVVLDIYCGISKKGAKQ